MTIERAKSPRSTPEAKSITPLERPLNNPPKGNPFGIDKKKKRLSHLFAQDSLEWLFYRNPVNGASDKTTRAFIATNGHQERSVKKKKKYCVAQGATPGAREGERIRAKSELYRGYYISCSLIALRQPVGRRCKRSAPFRFWLSVHSRVIFAYYTRKKKERESELMALLWGGKN